MGLSGNLEDLALSDIIQIIHLSKKTGILSLTNKLTQGAIVFHEGAIIQAVSSQKSVAVGEILIKRGLLTQDQIDLIFHLKGTVSPQKTAASLLIEKKMISRELLENLGRKFIEKAVSELLQWKEGSFDFEIDNTVLDESFGRDVDLTKLESGLTPQLLFSEVARKIQVPQQEGEPEHDNISTDQLKRGQAEINPPAEASVHSVPVEQEIPLKAELETAQPAPPSPEKPSEQKPSEIAGPRVLEKNIIIIDDEKVFLDLVTRKLKKKGFNVFSFIELEKALNQLDKLIEQNTVPILISDLVIPSEKSSDGLGGIDFLDEINISYPYIPVIIISDQHDPQIRYQAYEHGARNYLYKPDRSSIKISEITREIDRFGEELALCLNNIFRERERLNEMMVSISTINRVTRSAGMTRSGPKTSPSPQVDPELQKMKQIFYELQNPKETSEVILLVLRLASEHLERGILFLVQKDFLNGIGGFGYATDGEPITTKIPSFRISRKGHSIFNLVLNDRKMFTGIPDQSPINAELYKFIGKPFNEIVVAIPLLSEGRIIAIFYGDNGQRMKAVDNIVGLEIFVNQAGIALENALLQKRLKGK